MKGQKPMRYTVSLLCLMLAGSIAADDLRSSISADYPFLEGLYRHLHQHPEISFQEVQTAKRVGDELEHLGFEVTRDFGGHGVVGILRNGKGSTLMIRTDLDGLPIEEQTGLPFASVAVARDRDGKDTYTMHACGHDLHMTVFVGTARYLAKNRDQWQGTLMMIGQPAEERSGGAKAMLAEGLFEKFPRPDFNLALHVSSNLKAGTVAAVSGYFMANVDSVDILIKGQGGHGAYPHLSKDPVVLAARIVNALQTIVSREVSPLEPAVVTVGSIHGGSQHNIIPNEVKLQLTLRSYNFEVRDQTIASIRRIVSNTALAAGMGQDQLPVVTVLDEHTPAAYNNPDLTARMLAVFRHAIGDESVIEMQPEMVGEDFGRYGAVEPKIPSMMFRLGTVAEDRYELAQNGELSLPTLHSASYAPDAQPSIMTGVETMTAAALTLLQK
jgi:amidohydrolase